MSQQSYRADRVFVPGGRPTITYVPRTDLDLERRIDAYLSERHKILSVSGPTKTGKTVLLKQRVDDGARPIWLSGGVLATADDFWSSLSDALDLPTETGFDGGLSQTETGELSGGLSAGFASTSARTDESVTRSRTSVERRTSSPKQASRRSLQQDPDRVIVIDDFHYVPPAAQVEIVRGIKDLIFDGVACIVAAVPHRAYDVVRVEKEMTGRVSQVEVGFWSDGDLATIAHSGFAALNVVIDEDIVQRLVKESFQSPHLMQEFCRELCRSNGIVDGESSRGAVVSAPDWVPFFSSLAPGTSKAAFDLLARGPRQRSDRKVRLLHNGETTDIYGAVLRAIAHTGPLTSIEYERLRAALRSVLANSDDPPQKHEVTRVLDEMSKIAREQIEGEPVVDYDASLATLYISDPYFAYWLRWGTHNVEVPPG